MRISLLFKLVVAGAVAAPLVGRLAGAQTVDQHQDVNDGQYYGANTPLPNGLAAQSFTPAQSNISGAGVWLQYISGGNPSTMTVSLFNASQFVNASNSSVPCDAAHAGGGGENCVVVGSPLATASGTITLGAGSGWADVFFSNPVSVTPGASYFLQFSGMANQAGNTEQYAVGSSGGDPYSGGIDCPRNDGQYACFADHDLAFREYYTPASTTTTPEPSSMALLGTGMVGLLPMVRRKIRR